MSKDIYQQQKFTKKDAKRTLIALLILAAFLFFGQTRNFVEFAATRLKLPELAFWVSHDSSLFMGVGNYYFNGGAYNLSQAKQAYEKALELNPAVSLAHYQIARIHFLRGNFYYALDEINKEIAIHPEIPNSFYVRGLINGYLSDFPSAEADFKKFIELVPWQWAGYNDLAWILVKKGEFQEAENTILLAFTKIPETKTKNPWLWTSLGVARLNLKKYNEAREAFLTAIDMAEKMDAEYFWSAYPGNDGRGAESAYKQFLASLYFNLGVAYEGLNEFSMARKAYLDHLLQTPETSTLNQAIVKQKIKELADK